MLKARMSVRIVDHEGYENIHRVGDVGRIKKITEGTASVLFKGEKKTVDYPVEVLEAEQAQLGKGGKSGTPDTSRNTPPLVSKDDMGLKGEQKQVAQADSATSRPQAGSAQDAGVTSDDVELDGEQKQVPNATGGTSSATRPDTGGSQNAGVKGDQVELDGEQKQLSGVPGREVVKGVKESRVFRPVKIVVLEQGRGEDEYSVIGEGVSIRNERHLVAAVRGAMRHAMESMDRPFDSVEVVFRRNPLAESERRTAEKRLIAALHLLDEGKGDSKMVREAAHFAAKNGVRTARFIEYTDDRYAQKHLRDAEALVEQAVGGPVTIVWPPKNLGKHVGQHVIVESVFGDRWVGKLAKGPGRMFHIKTQSGTHKFSPNSVSRILVKPGAK